MSHFFLNLGQTAEDSEMFTNIWLSSIGLYIDMYVFRFFLYSFLFYYLFLYFSIIFYFYVVACNSAFEQGHLDPWRYINAFIIISIIYYNLCRCFLVEVRHLHRIRQFPLEHTERRYMLFPEYERHVLPCQFPQWFTDCGKSRE